ncbi:unnamed protein product [Litomosoides sigmodontis]|uniref:Uncharacterized protein n=1 Tax=Litomosoides sigmodontis TaxID=42156 RepID=A0A3P6TQJ8_LITSI|nr:unnamed protein product [Litomosoides sigmodontis]VDK85603.1 unnamed protein product [Litomosoides sigmodontis]
MFWIHLDLARYHELGRFVETSASVCSEKENVYSTKDYENKKNKENCVEFDKYSAFYHLDVARRCGVLEAIITMAKMAFGYSLYTYFLLNERLDLIRLSWPNAVVWYEKALKFLEGAETNENETPHEGVRPRYELLERQLCIKKLFLFPGGYGLLRDLTKAYDLYIEAAISATEAM